MEFACKPQMWGCSHNGLTRNGSPCPARTNRTIGYEDLQTHNADRLLPLNTTYNNTMQRTSQWKEHVAVVVGGSWYSVPAAGECVGTEEPSSHGCSWRLLAPPRIFNATCVNRRLRAAVEAYAATAPGGGCFRERCSAAELGDFGCDWYDAHAFPICARALLT